MIKAVFFDFDGVLSTHASGFYSTCLYLSEHTNVPVERLIECYKEHRQALNTGQVLHKDIWDSFCGCVGKEIDIALLHDAFFDTPRNEGVIDLVKEVKQHCKTGLITDNSTERFAVIYEAFRLPELFDTMITSADVGSMKDSEAIFQRALEEAGVSAQESAFIDNNEQNLLVPKEMGFRTYYHDDSKNDVPALRQWLQENGVLQ